MKQTSKRRRTKAQIEADKKNEEAKQQDTQAKLAQFASMEQRIATMEQSLSNASQMQAQVFNLMDHGVVKADADGNSWPVDDPRERESILQSKSKQNAQPSQLLGAPDGDALELMSQRSFHSAHEDVDLEDVS